MPSFVFSLQAVLDHRMRLEEEAQKIAAAIKARLDECQAGIGRLSQARRAAAAEMHTRLQEGMPDHERVIYSNYLEATAAQLAQMRAVEARIQSELVVARKVVIEAMLRRKIIEEARKVEHRAYLRAEMLEERKLYDDLGRRSWMQNKETMALRP